MGRWRREIVVEVRRRRVLEIVMRSYEVRDD